MTEPYHLARVGRTPETCDRCHATIPPHTLCYADKDGALYCQACTATLNRPLRKREV